MRKGAQIAAGLFIVAALYAPSLYDHMRASAGAFNDDVCQHVAPFLRPLDDGPPDYAARYCMATLPVGYRLLYRTAAGLGVVRQVSRWGGYVLLAVTLAALALAVRPLAGTVGMGCMVILALSCDVFLARSVNTSPRAFAYPVVAALMAAAAAGRPRAIAVLTWIGAAFYPVTAVIGGGTLAVLFVLPRADRGGAAAWSALRRARFLLLTALGAVMLVAPVYVALRPYGARIGPSDVAQFPEAGPGGRFADADRAGAARPLPGALVQAAPLAFYNRGAAWCPPCRSFLTRSGPLRIGLAVIFALGAAGMLRGGMRAPAGRRLLGVTAAVLAAYLLARACAPSLFTPQRYLFYAMPPLILAWLLIAAAGAGRTAILATTAVLLLGYGGRVDPHNGLTVRRERQAELYAALCRLPAGAFVAGWPNVVAPLPYLCARPVLVSYETHLPWHREYVLTMRRRMNDLIDALYAATPEPVRRLRDNWGVTHLVVPRARPGQPAHRYFAPFNARIRAAAADRGPRPYLLAELPETALVYRGPDYYILALDAFLEFRNGTRGVSSNVGPELPP
ncbi:MAG: hypothetical protein JW951_01145 [Lentisphaerae bacterium]|nr:hypothetical protein [Lentisphaerota bacterium]